MNDTEVNTNAEKNASTRAKSKVKPSPSHMKNAYSPNENQAFSELDTLSIPKQKSKLGRKKLKISSQKNTKLANTSPSPIAKRTPHLKKDINGSQPTWKNHFTKKFTICTVRVRLIKLRI